MDFKYHLIRISASGGIRYQHQGTNSNCNNILSLPIFPLFFCWIQVGPDPGRAYILVPVSDDAR
jgi:hypothetical protein